FFFFQAEDGIRDGHVTGVQTCALPISPASRAARSSAAPVRARLANLSLRPAANNFLVRSSGRSHPRELSLSRFPHAARAPACFRACHTSPHEESPYAAPARSVEPVSHHPARPLPGTCSPPLAPKSRMPPPTAPRTTLARRSANLAPHASSPAATPNTPQKRRHARRFPAPFVARSVSRVPAGRIRTLA